jgi:hypothetical protein
VVQLGRSAAAIHETLDDTGAFLRAPNRDGNDDRARGFRGARVSRVGPPMAEEAGDGSQRGACDQPKVRAKELDDRLLTRRIEAGPGHHA